MVAIPPTVAFLAKVEHGCLILRDVGSDGDVSEWDPESNAWYADGGSLIFGVQAGVDGPVKCEVWKSQPPAMLPAKLLEVTLPCPSGWLVLQDPNEYVKLQFAGARGAVLCSVRVDDLQVPAEVQILLEAAAT